MTKYRGRRVSLSMSPEDAMWIHGLIAALYRGADVSVQLRSDRAMRVIRILRSAAERGEKKGPPVPHRVVVPPAFISNQFQRTTHCRNGHEYTPENTGKSVNHGKVNRRCIICRSENGRRRRIRLREAEERQRTAELERLRAEQIERRSA